MVDVIPKGVKKLWDLWNLRVFILASLSLQAILILFSTSRKRSPRIGMIMFIWSAYLLADWVAAVTLGLISSSQGDDDTSGNDAQNGDLVAIWAPFLLLHLGGPDTITSFSMEDNELWLRHLFGLSAQVVGAVYVFIQTLTKNKLWVPTILVLVAGFIKYAERTRALYLASLDHFGESTFREPNPGPEYVRIQRLYSSLKTGNFPTRLKEVKGLGETFQDIKYKNESELGSLEPRPLFLYAYDFFEIFKCLVVGLVLSSQDGQVSRDFFLNRTANDAIKIAEIELSLLYEVLHTKAVVVQCRNGYTFRFIGFVSIIVAFLLFHLVEKQGFHDFDVIVTYALFTGALILDIISVSKLLLFDWTIIKFQNWWGKHMARHTINKSRWSNSILQLNMINYCLNHPQGWIYKITKFVGCENLLDRLWIVKTLKPFSLTKVPLTKFIFMELRMKSLKATDMKGAMAIGSKRGDWILEQSSYDPKLLTWSVKDVEYVESLLLWHIATELCWHHDETFKDINLRDNEDPSSSNIENHDHKVFSKHLSDYAFYLLLVQPTMMASVSGNWQMVFQDTLAEAKRYFSGKKYPLHSDACKTILKEPIDIKPAAVKGDSKSIFFDACRLAQELLELKGNRWELISKMWVEILSYAAVNCRANIHAQQPSKGGELLTLMWLLMHHFCLANQFYETNTARIKFILSK